MIIWEVLTRQVPWANEDSVEGIVWRVVIKRERPEIPADAPPDLADLASACWATEPERRPQFAVILKSMKTRAGNLA